MEGSRVDGGSVLAVPRLRNGQARSLRWLTPVMVVTDVLGVNLAFYLSYYLRYQVEWPTPVEEVFYAPYRYYFPIGLILSAVLLVTFRMEGLYSSKPGETWLDEFYHVVNATTTGIVAALVFYFVYRPNIYSRLVFIYATVLIVIFLSFNRWVKGLVLGYLRRRGIGISRVVLVGAGEVGRAVMRNIVAHPELGYQIVGFVDDDPEVGNSSLGRIPGLGPVSGLSKIVSSGNVDEVVVALPWSQHREAMAVIDECQRNGLRALVVPDLFQMSLSRVQVQDLDGIPLLGLSERSMSGVDRVIKRLVDIIGATFGLLVLALLYVPIAIAIKLDSPGPVLYTQERVGRGGKRFGIYKFRSMRQDADAMLPELQAQNEYDGPLFKMRDDPRCTRVGRILRRFSLDEWPQFINVMKGDLSLVGPRPNRPSEVANYKPWHRRRLDVSPGMSGLWQVSGRSDVPFDEMVLLDIYYIENWSLLLDLKIVLRTIPLLLFGRGAY